MSKTTNKSHRSISIDRFLNDDRQHLIARRVENLKDQLKREKQEDKIFYQSIKAKLAAC